MGHAIRTGGVYKNATFWLGELPSIRDSATAGLEECCTWELNLPSAANNRESRYHPKYGRAICGCKVSG